MYPYIPKKTGNEAQDRNFQEIQLAIQSIMAAITTLQTKIQNMGSK